LRHLAAAETSPRQQGLSANSIWSFYTKKLSSGSSTKAKRNHTCWQKYRSTASTTLNRSQLSTRLNLRTYHDVDRRSACPGVTIDEKAVRLALCGLMQKETRLTFEFARIVIDNDVIDRSCRELMVAQIDMKALVDLSSGRSRST
jgi:hypothetical protein